MQTLPPVAALAPPVAGGSTKGTDPAVCSVTGFGDFLSLAVLLLIGGPAEISVPVFGDPPGAGSGESKPVEPGIPEKPEGKDGASAGSDIPPLLDLPAAVSSSVASVWKAGKLPPPAESVHVSNRAPVTVGEAGITGVPSASMTMETMGGGETAGPPVPQKPGSPVFRAGKADDIPTPFADAAQPALSRPAEPARSAFLPPKGEATHITKTAPAGQPQYDPRMFGPSAFVDSATPGPFPPFPAEGIGEFSAPEGRNGSGAENRGGNRGRHATPAEGSPSDPPVFAHTPPGRPPSVDSASMRPGSLFPPHSPADDAFGERFVITKRDSSSLSVSVTPEGLGTIDVEVVLDRGIVSAHITAFDPAARETMERSLAQIVDALVREGIRVGGFSVSLGGKEKGKQGAAGEKALPSNETAAAIAEESPFAFRAPGSRGIVDIYT